MAIKAIDCTWATKGVTIAPILAIILQEPSPIALIEVGYTYKCTTCRKTQTMYK